MTSEPTVIILLFAAGLDYLIGDPWGWIHPVQVIGWCISTLTQFSLNRFKKKQQRHLAGILLGGGLIISSGGLSWLVLHCLDWVHPLLSISLAVVLLASCFAGQSLRKAALDVLYPLNLGNLDLARSHLSRYVGRDTQELSSEEILRATLETVAENTTDGVTAPLFYAIVGAFVPGIGSVPFAIAYKTASTLDSMIGYRREPYNDIGWFSAKLEDYLTWLPCRLTVLTLAIISGKPQQVLSLCRRDAPKDPSLNSGWSEGVYAAILGVQLGGINTYQGVVREKPLLGEPLVVITPEKVYQALRLTRWCFLSWLAIAAIGLVSFARFR